MDTLIPRDERDAIDIVTAAVANAAPLEVSGAATKTGLGRPVTAQARVSTGGMCGVSLYEPSELVLSARIGHATSRNYGFVGAARAGTRLRAHGLLRALSAWKEGPARSVD